MYVYCPTPNCKYKQEQRKVQAFKLGSVVFALVRTSHNLHTSYLKCTLPRTKLRARPTDTRTLYTRQCSTLFHSLSLFLSLQAHQLSQHSARSRIPLHKKVEITNYIISQETYNELQWLPLRMWLDVLFLHLLLERNSCCCSCFMVFSSSLSILHSIQNRKNTANEIANNHEPYSFPAVTCKWIRVFDELCARINSRHDSSFAPSLAFMSISYTIQNSAEAQFSVKKSGRKEWEWKSFKPD